MNEFPKSIRIPAGGPLSVWRETWAVTEGFLFVFFCLWWTLNISFSRAVLILSFAPIEIIIYRVKRDHLLIQIPQNCYRLYRLKSRGTLSVYN